MKLPKVIVICSQNSARSQMAEALLKKHAGDLFEIYSAGLEPETVNPYAVQVMQEIGIDISGQRAKSVKEFLGKMSFGYVITVCQKAESQCPAIFPGVAQLIAWPFEDPAAVEGTEEEKLVKFRQIRDQIEQRVKEWVASFRTNGEK